MTSAPGTRLREALAAAPRRIVACSGGVDSLLLADVAHQAAPASTVVAHSVTPAVPQAATERVRRTAAALGWRLRLVESAEFSDQRYLDNPVDRCFFCKTNLYDELDRVAAGLGDLVRGRSDGVEGGAEVGAGVGAGVVETVRESLGGSGWTLLSGANLDDLGDYRPGLLAAAQHEVRHPFVEAGLAKSDVRALAAERGRDWHDLPAAPCLASRLYTGTPVTPGVVRAVDAGEQTARRLTGLSVLRTRVRGDAVLVEVGAEDRDRVDADVLTQVLADMRHHAPALTTIELDPEPYAPGRSFLHLEPRP